MQSKLNTQDVSFQNCIYNYCENNETGTILIATNNNRSCQISIENGEVIAASLSRYKGYQVANELLKVGIRKASFTQGVKFPHIGEAKITSSKIFLEKLENIPHLTLVK